MGKMKETIIFQLKNARNMIVCRLRTPCRWGNEGNYHISTKKCPQYDSLSPATAISDGEMKETIIFQLKNARNMIVCRLRAPCRWGNEGNYHISTKKCPQYDSLSPAGAVSEGEMKETIILRLKNARNMIVCRLRASYLMGK